MKPVPHTTESITIQGQTIPYTLKISARAKHIRLAIYKDGSFVVTAPKRADKERVQSFIYDKSAWILQKINHFKARPHIGLGTGNAKEFIIHKERALRLVESRLTYFNAAYGYIWKNITIRNQSTRWGSCSKQGNLNFNYKIVLLPPELADYIVVHELCHIGQLNHSSKFWDLFEQTIPDYKVLRKALKDI